MLILKYAEPVKDSCYRTSQFPFAFIHNISHNNYPVKWPVIQKGKTRSTKRIFPGGALRSASQDRSGRANLYLDPHRRNKSALQCAAL